MSPLQCRCCEAAASELIPEHGFRHWACSACGHEMFAVAQGTATAELYENDSDYSDDLLVATGVQDLLLWHHRKAMRYVASVPAGSTTLDVGCFNGFFVSQLQHLGFDSYGVDFNSRAIRH